MANVHRVRLGEEMKMNLHADVDLIAESDRGVVLIVANDIEQLLESLFKKAFAGRVSNTIQEALFDLNGPLGSLSGKGKLAFAVGLLERPLYDHLDLLRRLRNQVAHDSKEFSFDAPTTLSLLNSFDIFRQLVPQWLKKPVVLKPDEPDPEGVLVVSINKFCFIQTFSFMKQLLERNIQHAKAFTDAQFE
jgi:hypothetical protein